MELKLAKARASLGYQTEEAKGKFADELWEAMEHRGLSQVDFAAQAGVTKQFLTKIFKGGNCTIETMVKLAFALKYKFHVHLSPVEVDCDWIHEITAGNTRPPERFLQLWTEQGYQSQKTLKKEQSATVTTVP
jgi:transcriptional regulator with XRE-family HTH domain